MAFKFTDFHLGPGDYVELTSARTKARSRPYTTSSSPNLDHWLLTDSQNMFADFVSSTQFTFRGFEMKIKFVKRPLGITFVHFFEINIVT